VGYRSICDSSPRRYALAATATAALGGLLGCGTTGLGGAAGTVLGLVAGGVAGWIVAGRTAHA
jgi:outer membrane lipoprotein SlyB